MSDPRFALIDPRDKRVHDIRPEAFHVAHPYFWVDVTARPEVDRSWTFNGEDASGVLVAPDAPDAKPGAGTVAF